MPIVSRQLLFCVGHCYGVGHALEGIAGKVHVKLADCLHRRKALQVPVVSFGLGPCLPQHTGCTCSPSSLCLKIYAVPLVLVSVVSKKG